MELNRGLPVQMGAINGFVFGGKYREYKPGTRRLVGVKMAVEIDHPSDFNVDTEDFSVPDVKAMQDGLIFGIKAMHTGNDVYVGCWGGVGRTGLYLACMFKVVAAFQDRARGVHQAHDYVGYVRARYMPHAVETQQQQAYVDNFDVSRVLVEVDKLLGPKVVMVEKVVEVVKYLTPLQWALSKLPKPIGSFFNV